jgi:hypothetical protein
MQVASNLPITSIRNAPLPQTYVNAKTALESCQAVDECKDWADKAAALASYARQADDVELEKMAVRIRSRALRRAGELAKQMMQPHGSNQHSKRGDDGTVISLMPKEKVQEVSGFSERQLNTAIRIANIPREDFERRIESPSPPTVTDLAAEGTIPRKPLNPETWLKGRSPADFNLAMQAEATIENYAKELAEYDWERVVLILDDGERQTIRKAIATIDAIHDKIATRI